MNFRIEDSNLTKDHSSKIHQFVHNIVDFSSQYGKENSKSYSVLNLKSGPYNFPKYGDFLESCVLVKEHR